VRERGLELLDAFIDEARAQELLGRARPQADLVVPLRAVGGRAERGGGGGTAPGVRERLGVVDGEELAAARRCELERERVQIGRTIECELVLREIRRALRVEQRLRVVASGAELVPPDLQTSRGFTDYIKKEFENSKAAAQVAGLKPE